MKTDDENLTKMHLDILASDKSSREAKEEAFVFLAESLEISGEMKLKVAKFLAECATLGANQMATTIESNLGMKADRLLKEIFEIDLNQWAH